MGHAVDALEVFEFAIWPSGDYHMYFGRNENYTFNKALITDDGFLGYFATTPSHTDINTLDDRSQEIALVLLNSEDLTGYQNNRDVHPVFEYYWINNLTHKYKNPRIDISLEQYKENIINVPVESSK